MYGNISRDGCYGQNFQFVRGSQGREKRDGVVWGRIGIDDDRAWHVNVSTQLVQRLLSLWMTGMLLEEIEQHSRLFSVSQPNPDWPKPDFASRQVV